MLVKEFNRDCSTCVFKHNDLCKSTLENNVDGSFSKGACLSWDEEDDLDILLEQALIKKTKRDELAAKRLEEKEYVAVENEVIKNLKANIAQVESTYNLLVSSTELLKLIEDDFSSLKQKTELTRLNEMQKELKKLNMELSRVEEQRKNKLKERRKNLKAKQAEEVVDVC